MRTAFSYYGGKMGLASRLVALMPPHRVYVEPFFGSGAVLMAKPPAPHEIINDINDDLVNFWRVLREQRGALEEACALTPHSRIEYLDCRNRLADRDVDDVERARRWWVCVNQGFAKTANSNTGWSVTVSRTQSVQGSVLSRLNRFGGIAKRISGAAIENCDAVGLIGRIAKTDDTLVYADPPYLAETRVTRHGNAGDYQFDMGSPDHHRRLAEALHATKANVLVSGYSSDLYDELYGSWNCVDFAVTAFSSNASTQHRSGRTESVWMNYDPPGQTSLDLATTARPIISEVPPCQDQHNGNAPAGALHEWSSLNGAVMSSSLSGRHSPLGLGG